MTYEIRTDTIYLQIEKTYQKVLTINTIPEGPLSSIVKTIKHNINTINTLRNTNYINVILNPNNTTEYLFEDDLAVFISYLRENGYSIDTMLTKVLQNKYRDILFYIVSP
jgi:hypothetical protein